MKKKPVNEFTAEEKEWMDTVAVNYVLAQSDGFQSGYAQAISDFTDGIVDYWKNSDDTVQHSVLDMLVDLGENLNKRKAVVEKNIKTANDSGYESYYNWSFKLKDMSFERHVPLYARSENDE